MLVFVFEGRRVTVDPLTLTLSSLLDIYTQDRSGDKRDAIKALTYIHLVAQIDENAPYFRANPDEVGRIVRKEIYGSYDYKFGTTDPYTEEQIDEAAIQYQTAYETPEHSMVRSYDKKIYEIKDLVDSTKIEIKPSISKGVVSYVSNFPILNKMLQDVVHISESREKLRASIVKESVKDNMKAKRVKSFLEKRRAESQKSVVMPGTTGSPEAESEETSL